MTVQGAPQLRARLDAVGKVGPTILDRLALLIVREAKQRVARKTAQTSRTIRIASRSKSRVTVTAGGAARFLEFGTRPHVIRPRTKKALRFPAAGSGAPRLSGRPRKGQAVTFARFVRHPGTRKQPFMGPAIAAARRKADAKSAVVVAWDSAA